MLVLFAQANPVGDTLQLSLEAALARALRANATLEAARADARAAGALPLQASPALLPSIQADVRGVRTSDPVAVFGFKLRQATFGPDDFAPAALNRPDPFTSYSTSVTVEQPIFVPEGLFEYRSARGGASAQMAAADRTKGAIAFQVTRAYWDARLGAHRREALGVALAAARGHAARAEALHNQGLVTGLDARLARIAAAEIEAQQLLAGAEADNALSGLRVLLGLPESQPIGLTDSMPGRGAPACESGSCNIEDRGDLKAQRLGAEAASLAVRKAWASNLPSIALFGTVARYGASAPWSGGSGDWTVGIGLSWRPFPALAGVGAVRRAKAERDAAAARSEAARRQAELEVLQAERSLAAARARVEVAERAAAEADEALAQAQLRYGTGASSITELLDVQAATTNATVNLLSAHRDLFVAQAALEFAYGVYDQ